MEITNFSEARKNLNEICNKVTNDKNYMVITRRDSEDVVVMPLELFNSMIETLYLLRSSKNAKKLMQSIEQFKNNQVKERDIIDV